MSTNIRIFKLITGEMVIARVELPKGADDLRSAYSFTAITPLLFHMGPNGYGFVPMFPWCDTKRGAKATIYGETVCAVADDSSEHSEIIQQYTEATSSVTLATSLSMPNVRPLR